jgi:hypothetical protein
MYIAILHPYAANTVRGQVNSSTNVAAVRNLTIEAGAAGRARVPSQVFPMVMVPPRPKVTVASVDDSSSFGAHGYTPVEVASPVAAMEPYWHQDGHGEQCGSGSEI